MCWKVEGSQLRGRSQINKVGGPERTVGAQAGVRSRAGRSGLRQQNGHHPCWDKREEGHGRAGTRGARLVGLALERVKTCPFLHPRSGGHLLGEAWSEAQEK